MSKMLYNMLVADMRTWRNWQTLRPQKPVVNSVWVQVPSSAPTKKRTFVYQDKVRFLNDVCLRQMMLASPMMTLSLMMCGYATFYGKHRFLAARSDATSFRSAATKHHQPPSAATSLTIRWKNDIINSTNQNLQRSFVICRHRKNSEKRLPNLQ